MGALRRTVAAGSMVFRAGEACRGIHVLTRGLVAVQRNTVQGETLILRLTFPVSAFGIEAWVRSGRHDSDAVALVESVVCLLDSTRAQQFLALNPEARTALMVRLAADLVASEESALMLGKAAARERFRRLLRLLLDHAPDRAPSRAWPGAQRFRLPSSRQQLAAMLGIRPETLSRTIRQAQREGWLRLQGRWAEILLPHAGARKQSATR
jgi:CRP-like cAMP-binding protein